VLVELHPLGSAAKLYGMGALGPDYVIVVLIGVPRVVEIRIRIHSAEEGRNAALRVKTRSILTRQRAQSGLAAKGIDRRRGELVDDIVAVETNAGRVHQRGAERVTLLHGDGCPARA